MKVQLLIPLTLVVSVALLALMQMRKKEQDKEDKRHRFESIKLRVTHDVLGEYQTEMAEMNNRLEKNKNDLKVLEEQVNAVQVKADRAKGDAEGCQGGKKAATDELATVETEFNNLKAETDKEKTDWATEVETLKQQLAGRSAVCDFLKEGSQEGRKLCGNEVKQGEPTKEESKPEEAKAEAPKPEEAMAEAPKPEEAKAEAPKPEETMAEAPKPEEAKAEAPKPEEAKAEAPKPEEPKAEAPAQDQPKAR